MATWGYINRLPVMLSSGFCNANKQLLKVKVNRALSLHPALRHYVFRPDDHRNLEIGVTREGETIVCYHPAPSIAYKLTKPIPKPEHHFTECHDLVLKSRLSTDLLTDRKTPPIEELAKMFYTTKHRWYPVGQYHTRRRIRNPPKDRMM